SRRGILKYAAAQILALSTTGSNSSPLGSNTTRRRLPGRLTVLGDKSWVECFPWGKPWDIQFPANGAGNWCQSRVCGVSRPDAAEWLPGHHPTLPPPARLRIRQMAAIPESAKLFMSGLIERARKLKKTIVFPEGTDARVLEAAARLAREGVVKPVLIGARPANAPEGVEFVDPATSPLVKKYAALYYERRRA